MPLRSLALFAIASILGASILAVRGLDEDRGDASVSPSASRSIAPAAVSAPLRIERRAEPAPVPSARGTRRAAVEVPEPRIVPGRLVPPPSADEDGPVTVVLTGFTDAVLLTQPFAHLGWVQSEWPVLDRSTVRSDGQFEIRLPERLIQGVVELEAGLAYLEEPVTIRGDDLPDRLDLRAVRGARLELALVPSPSSTLDPAVLVGRRLRLGWRSASPTLFFGSPPSDTIALSDGLRATYGPLRPDQVYELSSGFDAELAPFAPIDVPEIRPSPGQRIVLRVPIEDGVVARGRVVSSGGEPVVGAWVQTRALLRNDRGWRAQGDTKTDEQGRFELVGLGTTLASLRAGRLGYREATWSPPDLWPGRVLEGIELVLQPASEGH